jgi:hypothetical protein
MKTKTLLLLCLFLGIGLTGLYAQPPVVDGTKSVVTTEIWPYYDSGPVFCNGQVVDELFGSVKLHHVWHFEDGIWVWANHTVDGEVSSIHTNEVFKVKEIDKMDMIQERVPYHVNFIGNNGSHYIMSATFDWSTGITTINKAVCVENGRNK